MQIQFIESLIELYREGNMTRASAKLCITQQGLSRQIQAIERELDVSLFERSRSGVSPSGICSELYPHLERIAGEYALLLGAIEAHRQAEARKSLKLAFAIGLSNCINTDFIFAYQKAHPELSIRIEEWAEPVCIQKLLSGGLDLAFLVNPFDARLFRSYPLAEDYMFAAIHKSNPLAAWETPLDFAALDGERIITGAPDNALRALFDHFCALSGIKPQVIVSSSYSLNFANAMSENVGITTVTSAMAARITNPDIVIRRLVTPEPGVMYCCVPLHEEAGTEGSALLRYIRNYFETTPMPRFKET